MHTTAHYPIPTAISKHPSPIIRELGVPDADLIRTDNPFIQTIHIWVVVFGEPEPQQHETTGRDLLDWLCNVENRIYGTVLDYWYTTHPFTRNGDMARYLMYRTDNLTAKSN